MGNKGSKQKIPELRKSEKVNIFYLILVSGISLISYFYNLGRPSLSLLNEVRQAEIGREMLEQGNWFIPHFNYQIYLYKGIMFYWALALSYLIFGVNEFAARFPSAFAGMILSLSIFLFVTKLRNPFCGFISSVVSLNLMTIISGKDASHDITLTLFITLSLFSFFLGYSSRDKNFLKNVFYLLTYLFAGFSILTKGPVGIIPFLVIFVFIIVVGGFKTLLKEMFIFPGIIVFLTVVLPWYIYGYRTVGEDFIRIPLELYTGLYGTEFQIRDIHGPFYYPGVIIFGFYPWSAFLPIIFLENFVRIKKLKNLPRDSHLSIYLTVWFLTVFFVFSLSKTKLPHYILSLFPASSLLVGEFFYKYITGKRKSYYSLKISAFFLIIFGSCMLIFFFPKNPVFLNIITGFWESEKKINFGIIPHLLFITLLSGILFSLFFNVY